VSSSSPEPEPIDGFARLIELARGGSSPALGDLLEACRRQLLQEIEGDLRRDLQAKGDVADLVQETFLEAQRDFPHFQGATRPEFYAWLRSILFHKLAHFCRRYRQAGKRAVNRELSLEGSGLAETLPRRRGRRDSTPSLHAMKREQAQHLEQAMSRLPEDAQQVLNLRQENLTFEEIGSRLGRSAEAARKLWQRAIARLQDELRAYE
jgi:RNA polymerase sigma-70 factor (ECF subfamily)